jgi:hypothetical protein
MKRLLPAALCLLLLNGCLFWNKKPSGPAPEKEVPTVATSVEKDFKVRWVEKRSSDLIAQGVNASAAHDQAVAEFDAKFPDTHVATEGK